MKNELKEKLRSSFDSVSISKGIVTVRQGFFYRMNKTSDDLVNKVKTLFPQAKIIDSGEIWKPFKGGATVKNKSHWFVKFIVEE